MSSNPRIYNELSWLWPIWGSHADYFEESNKIVELIRKHSPSNNENDKLTLLDIGCGGGNNDYTLSKYLSVTGIDISNAMLDHARAMNPDCEYIRADMRHFDLGRRFDSVFLNHSIVYMNTREDLIRAMRCAAAHLQPDGVLIGYLEIYRENFVQNAISASRTIKDVVEHGETVSHDVIFIQNNFDRDPADSHFDMTMLMLIRQNGEQIGRAHV